MAWMTSPFCQHFFQRSFWDWYPHQSAVTLPVDFHDQATWILRNLLRLNGKQWDWPEDFQGQMQDRDGSREDLTLFPCWNWPQYCWREQGFRSAVPIGIAIWQIDSGIVAQFSNGYHSTLIGRVWGLGERLLGEGGEPKARNSVEIWGRGFWTQIIYRSGTQGDRETFPGQPGLDSQGSLIKPKGNSELGFRLRPEFLIPGGIWNQGTGGIPFGVNFPRAPNKPRPRLVIGIYWPAKGGTTLSIKPGKGTHLVVSQEGGVFLGLQGPVGRNLIIGWIWTFPGISGEIFPRGGTPEKGPKVWVCLGEPLCPQFQQKALPGGFGASEKVGSRGREKEPGV